MLRRYRTRSKLSNQRNKELSLPVNVQYNEASGPFSLTSADLCAE